MLSGRIVDAMPPADSNQRARDLACHVGGIFRHEHPVVIGIALAELVAAHAAGHRNIDDTARLTLIEAHAEAVLAMFRVFNEAAKRAESET